MIGHQLPKVNSAPIEVNIAATGDIKNANIAPIVPHIIHAYAISCNSIANIKYMYAIVLMLVDRVTS